MGCPSCFLFRLQSGGNYDGDDAEEQYEAPVFNRELQRNTASSRSEPGGGAPIYDLGGVGRMGSDAPPVLPPDRAGGAPIYDLGGVGRIGSDAPPVLPPDREDERIVLDDEGDDYADPNAIADCDVDTDHYRLNAEAPKMSGYAEIDTHREGRDLATEEEEDGDAEGTDFVAVDDDSEYLQLGEDSWAQESSS